MLEFPRWKYFLILVVLAVSALYALPNVYQKDPSVQITANRGGQIDDALKQRVSAALGEAGVTPKSVEKEGESLIVRLGSLDAQTRANDVLREKAGENYTVALNLASTVPHWLSSLGGQPMVLGLDLQGGVHFVLQVDQKAALEKRIDSYVEDVRVTLRDWRADALPEPKTLDVLHVAADGIHHAEFVEDVAGGAVSHFSAADVHHPHCHAALSQRGKRRGARCGAQNRGRTGPLARRGHARRCHPARVCR